MQIVDPLFGPLRFRRTLGLIGNGFWEGQVNFGPVGKHVSICVMAGRKGVAEAQRNFYRELEQRYSGLVSKISSVVLETPLRYWGNNFFGNFMPELDWEDFKLERIVIEKLNPENAIHWQLSYRYLPMADTYSVSFEGWETISGELDD